MEQPREYESTDSPLLPLLNVMYCVRVSLRTVKIFLAQHKGKKVMGNLCISLRLPNSRKFSRVMDPEIPVSGRGRGPTKKIDMVTVYNPYIATVAI